MRAVGTECSMQKKRQTDKHDEANSLFSQFFWEGVKNQRHLILFRFYNLNLIKVILVFSHNVH
jgi:hypothetical protein